MNDRAIREHVARVLSWHDAHVSFEQAIAALPPALRGRLAEGIPWSVWQLVEHLRIAQGDILEFCRGRAYRAKSWPTDYWPARPAPPRTGAWRASVTVYRSDRAALARMARDKSIDLLAVVPNGTTQTFLRELLLAADHAAYHVGQIVAVR